MEGGGDSPIPDFPFSFGTDPSLHPLLPAMPTNADTPPPPTKPTSSFFPPLLLFCNTPQAQQRWDLRPEEEGRRRRQRWRLLSLLCGNPSFSPAAAKADPSLPRPLVGFRVRGEVVPIPVGERDGILFSLTLRIFSWQGHTFSASPSTFGRRANLPPLKWMELVLHVRSRIPPLDETNLPLPLSPLPPDSACGTSKTLLVLVPPSPPI